MKMQELAEKGKNYLMNTYNFGSIVIEKGEGCYLYDVEGNKYLDFVSGIAVNSLGYSNKAFVEKMTSQLNKFNHCSNLYFNIPQVELAQTLVENSAFDRVFFCNSGAESVEAALKLAKKYGKKTHGEACFEIITMKNSFHGRTLGAVAVTGQTKYQKDLAPLLPGVVYGEYNNFESVNALVSEKTCAILVEPIQGEGGIKPAEKEFLQLLRTLCSEKKIILIYDEVQCGCGRTGTLFCYENYGIAPDVICLAKGLANGFPIGAMMATQKAAEAFSPGDHASTFGGNPLAATSASVVLDELLNKNLLENVKKQGEYLQKLLSGLKEEFPIIKDVRGIGLMLGVELTSSASEIVKKCLEKGLFLVGAGPDVVRFVPPLVVQREDIDEAVKIFKNALGEL